MKLLLYKLITCITICVVIVSSPEPAQAAPNFIIINTDDMRDDDRNFLPQTLGLLGDQGTRFINSFVVDAVCCPSRASLLRGQYSHNHGVLSNTPGIGGYSAFFNNGLESSTLATWLNDAGYSTVLIGKYMNGYPLTGSESYIPPGWGEWYGLFEDPYNVQYRINKNGITVHYGNTEAEYLTDVLSGLALDYLDRHQNDAAPLFMYLAPIAPHSPATPALRHRLAYPGLVAPRPPSFNETDVSDKPQWVKDQPIMSSKTISGIDKLYRKRAQSLLAVDEMVAALVGRLSAQGKLDNTFIFFTSDNGWMNGEHRLSQGKANAYEESIRVPMLVRGPGIAAGRLLDHFMLNIDIAPTIASLAGTTTPTFVDGHSLAAVLTAVATPPAPIGERFLVERLVAGGATGYIMPVHKALRTADYLYVTYPATGERELYDLLVDPYQINSLHASADQTLINQLDLWLSELELCSGELACHPR